MGRGALLALRRRRRYRRGISVRVALRRYGQRPVGGGVVRVHIHIRAQPYASGFFGGDGIIGFKKEFFSPAARRNVIARTILRLLPRTIGWLGIRI